MRADTLAARRVLAYAPLILYRRKATAADLANRMIRPTLYSRLAVSR
jgi:hypothetical protein